MDQGKLVLTCGDVEIAGIVVPPLSVSKSRLRPVSATDTRTETCLQ